MTGNRNAGYTQYPALKIVRIGFAQLLGRLFFEVFLESFKKHGRGAILGSRGGYTGASVLDSCLMSRKTDRYMTRTKMTNTSVDWAVPLMQQVS